MDSINNSQVILEQFKQLHIVLEEIINDISQLKSSQSFSPANDEMLTKQEAALFMHCDEQMVKKLENEGRIINYGRGRLLRYKKSELMDLREVRNAKK